MKILSNVLIKAGLIVEGAADFQDGTTAVTVATSDNSTKVATTAFVKNQGYALDSGVVHLSGAETITGVKTFSSSVTGNASAAIFSPTLTASGNFNVMVGVDVNPTFVNGSYTSLQNIALRVQGLMQVGTSGSFAANSTIAAFGYNANSQVSITYGSTFDITTLNVGNSFSITRNGASVPSMNASQGLNYYGGPLSLYGVFNGTTYPPGELRITGNYGFGSAAIGAYNSANSALFIGNSHTTYAYTQFTYARNVVWQQTDTSTSPTYNASAIFNLQSTTRGMLIPRMTTTQRDAIATPATGLEVYNTTTNRKNVYNGSTWVDLAVSGDLSSYVPASRTITINGTSYDLTADRSWSVTPNVNAFQEYTYTATAGQTTFAATYTVGQVQVYYNGSKLEPVEYTATNGTSIVFSPGLNAGDIVDIIAYQTGAGIGYGSLSATGPLTYNSGTGAFAIQKADSIKDGYLSSTDWSTFNNKLSLSGGTLTGALTGTTATFSSTAGNQIVAYYDASNYANIQHNGIYTKANTLLFGTSLTTDGIAIVDGKAGIGTRSPIFPLHVSASYNKTTTTGSAQMFISTSEAAASNPFGLRFQVFGGAAISNRYATLQTTDYNLADGGSIILQPGGGNVGVGTTNAIDRLTVSGRLNMLGLSQNSIWFNQSSGGTSNGYIVGRSYASNDAQDFFVYDVAASAFRMNVTSSGNVGINVTNPTNRLQVSGNIYSTDTVFGRNIKPEAWTTISAGTPSSAGIPMGYSTVNINSVCDNQWRTVLSNINDAKFFMWVTLGDAASKDTASYSFAMTSPAYGVSSMANLTYTDGGWNTGGFEFTYSSANGTHTLLVRCTSYYNSGNTAYGTIYFLRLE